MGPKTLAQILVDMLIADLRNHSGFDALFEEVEYDVLFHEIIPDLEEKIDTAITAYLRGERDFG